MNKSKYYVKLIGKQSEIYVRIFGTDTVPINPPIPLNTPQGVGFGVDTNLLTLEQKLRLIKVISSENRIPEKEVKKSLLKDGKVFPIPIQNCILAKVNGDTISVIDVKKKIAKMEPVHKRVSPVAPPPVATEA